MRFNSGQLVSRDFFLSRDPIVVWEAPTRGTSALASFTTDTEGAVVQDSIRHIKTLNSFSSRFHDIRLQENARGSYKVRNNSPVAAFQSTSGRAAKTSSAGRPPSGATAPAR